MSPAKQEAQPVCSFPAGWGERFDAFTSPNGDCPIPVSAMQEYMENCHKHYCLDEELTSYRHFELAKRFAFPDRWFWVWTCLDGFGREWFLCVGSGLTPFNEESRIRNWCLAARYESRPEPEQVLLADFPEYEAASMKAN